MFTIAHFSDVHLSPLPRARLSELMGKRASGFLSWHLNRVKIHRAEVLSRVMEDIAGAKPDHLAFTGDLVNLAMPAEIEAGARFLRSLGDPRDVTMVPGNHDCYTPSGHAEALVRLRPWMSGDAPGETVFPFARYRRNVAIIGVSTGLPTPIFQAWGKVGAEQLERLAALLEQTRAKGFARVVMLHHPPAPGLAKPRKALADAAALTDVLARHGAELVLYGHTHQLQTHVIGGAQGPVACFGMPSASALPHGHHPAAAWARYTLRRRDGNWHVSACLRGYDSATGRMETLREFTLEDSA